MCTAIELLTCEWFFLTEFQNKVAVVRKKMSDGHTPTRLSENYDILGTYLILFISLFTDSFVIIPITIDAIENVSIIILHIVFSNSHRNGIVLITVW